MGELLKEKVVKNGTAGITHIGLYQAILSQKSDHLRI
jgi:hypothetical protein